MLIKNLGILKIWLQGIWLPQGLLKQKDMTILTMGALLLMKQYFQQTDILNLCKKLIIMDILFRRII